MKKTLLILCALVCGTLAFAQSYTGNLHVWVDGEDDGSVESSITVAYDEEDNSKLDFTLHDFAISIGSLDLDLGDITVNGVDVTEGTDGVATFSCTDDHDVTFDSSLSSLVSDISVAMTGTISEDALYANMTISVDVGFGSLTIGSYTITATFASSGYGLNGDYLIMNAETGNYLAGGLAWGTQAMEGGRPQFFTLEGTGDVYTLDSHQTNGGDNHYLGTGLYCDAASANWTFAASGDGYTIYNSEAGGYLKSNGLQTAITATTNSSEATVWKLVTKDEIIDQMSSASTTSPVDVSALIPSCEPKRNSWGDVQTTGVWTATGYNVTAVPANYSFGQNGNVASCTESYYSTNGFDIRQSVTFPKKGVYVLSAQAFYSGTAGAVMYVSSSDGTGYNVSGNSVALPAQGGTSANNMVSAYQEFLEGQHPVSLQFTVYSDDTELYVGFSSAATSNSAWNIFGELGLQYYGDISYSIGEPQCAASCVKPGSTVSITYPDCITPTEGESPTLSTSVSITVGSTAVTDASLSYSGTTATVTFTLPAGVGYGETVTVTVPAGLLSWSGTSVSSAAGTFTLTTPAMEDQNGVYLYSVNADQFMSRGGESSDVLETWGELAATDVYGIPLDITFGDDGFATIKFLDSQLYLYGDGWAWTDAVEANAGKYAVKELTVDGETVYQFCYDGLEDTYLYVNVQSHNYVASNGNLTGDNNLEGDITRTYWQIFSVDERNAHKAARELNDHIAIAEAAGAIVTTEDGFQSYLGGLTETDVTSMVADAELAGSLTGWTEEDYNSSSSLFTSNTNGTEIYQGDAKLSQTIESLEEGIYKVTLQGFVRQGSSSNILTNNLGVYDLSIGFLEANGYQTNIMPWAEDREKVTGVTLTDSYPGTMEEASNCFSQGLYVNELYTYVDEDGTLELSINCPDALSGGWMMVKNLTLTKLGGTISWEMTDAGWGTLILPFAAAVPDGLTLYSGDALTIDGSTITVGTAAESIAANTPYLVSGAEGTYSFSGVATNTQDSYTTGVLTGTFVEMNYTALSNAAGTGTIYLLQNHQTTDTDYVDGEGTGVGFYPVTTDSENTGVSLTPYHCYLTLSSASGVRAYIGLPDSGEATGIVAVESDMIAGDAIYDLSGRKVSKAVKGVYIQNGKKVLVR